MQSAVTADSPSQDRSWHSEFTRQLERQRLSAIQFLAGQSQSMQELEAQLSGDLQALRAAQQGQTRREHDWTEKQERSAQARADQQRQLDAKAAELNERESALQTQLASLGQLRQQWEAEVADKSHALEQADASLRDRQRTLELDWSLRERQLAELESQAATLQKELHQLKERQAELQQREEGLQVKNAQLEERYNELIAGQAELERLQARLHADQHAHELAAKELEQARQQLQQAQAQLQAARQDFRTAQQAWEDRVRQEGAGASTSPEFEQLQTELSQAVAARQSLEQQLQATVQELRLAERRLDAMQSELDSTDARNCATVISGGDGDGDRDNYAAAVQSAKLEEAARVAIERQQQLERECTALQKELELSREARELVEAKLSHVQSDLAGASGQESELVADYLSRAEIAEAELGNLRLEIRKLQERLSAQAFATGGAMDWESRKRQMLADLENEGDGIPQDASSDHSLLLATQQALEKRDSDLLELRRLLEEKELQQTTYDAKLLAMEQDEIIQQQREQLKQLQEEWQNTLRQAEVELSVQRARLARERTELEEKQAELEQKSKQFRPAEGTSNKTPKRNWLSRLGLDKEQG